MNGGEQRRGIVRGPCSVLKKNADKSRQRMAALEEELRQLRANDGTALDLGGHGIGAAGAAVVAQELQGNHTLT